MITSHPQNHRVLLVDDEQDALDTFSLMLQREGIGDVATLSESRQVMPYLAHTPVDIIVLDLSMPHLTGNELLLRIREEHPEIQIIISTAANDLETAVDCMKRGAVDYLVKPLEKTRFISSIRKALQLLDLRGETAALKNSLLQGNLRHPEVFSAINTGNRRMFDIFRYVEAIAGSKQPVFITGETGVGKEMIAKAVHAASGRSGEFVAVNAAGLDDTMFSDALFGHERGAFTGADSRRSGLIAQAANGTLFLDEIGDLNEASQVKLLRLLQEDVYYPIGSDLQKRSSARIVAATNKDPRQMVQANAMRKDLYFRLCTHHILVPPLRERPEDIPVLLDRFLADAAVSLHKKKPTTPRDLAPFLMTYPFPGNIRELQSMVIDAVAQHTSGILSMRVFREQTKAMGNFEGPHPESGGQAGTHPAYAAETFPTLMQVEKIYVREALRIAKGNRSTTASLLGISRQALYKKLKNDPELLSLDYDPQDR